MFSFVCAVSLFLIWISELPEQEVVLNGRRYVLLGNEEDLLKKDVWVNKRVVPRVARRYQGHIYGLSV